jgi:putative PEP-CTERM system TPR-repeat lipoprotein
MISEAFLRPNPIQRRWAACAATLFVTLLCACGEPSDTDLIASAKQSLQSGDIGAAGLHLKSALQQNPQSAQARYLLGSVLLKAGDARAAVVELEKARDLRHDDTEVLPTLVRALLLSGQAKKATDLYAEIDLREPKAAAELKALIAAAYFGQGQDERGAAALQKAMALDPANPSARLLKARHLAGDGELDEALELVEAVIREDRTQRDAWQLKGELLSSGRGDSAEAMKAFREAVALDPSYIPAHSAILFLALRSNDVAGFKQQVAALQKAWPHHPDTKLYLAQVALLEQNIVKAREGIQQLLKVMPDSPRVLNLAGAIEFEAGSMLMAETHLNKALQLSPNLYPARKLLAQTYVRAGEPGKALDTLEPLLGSRASAPAEILAIAAEAQLQSGNLAKAEQLFSRAASVNPKDVKSRTALALTAIARGKVDSGFNELESLSSDQADSYADLALISARLRRQETDAALKAVDRLETKMPGKPLPHQLRANTLLVRRDLAGARASFEKALAADAAYFPAAQALAELDIASGKPEEARQRYESILARDPKSYRAMLGIADLRLRARAPTSEITNLLTNAVRAAPTETLPRVKLVDHLLANGDIKGARTAAQEAAAALPARPPILALLGRTQLASGETQQAIASFGKAANGDPGSAQYLLLLGQAQSVNRDPAAAVRTLHKALEVQRDFLPAQRGLIQLAITDGRFVDALETARGVQRQRPKDAEGYLLEADVHQAQKRPDLSVGALRSALERRSASDVAVRLHASYVAAGRANEARQFATKWLDSHARDAGFEFHLGTLAIENKDYAGAEERFKRVLEITPENPIALNNLAWLLMAQKKPGARMLAEKANSLLPNQAGIMDTLASALGAEGMFAEALHWQRKAIALSPKEPLYKLSLARLQIRSGESKAARETLSELTKASLQADTRAEVDALLKTL